MTPTQGNNPASQEPHRDPPQPVAQDLGAMVGESSAGDSMISRLLVEKGLATNEEINACASIRSKLAESGRIHSLEEILISKGVVTARQVSRLRNVAAKPQGDLHIPGYHIHERLGSGAMGAVYHATQLSIQRAVAIKVLSAKYTAEPSYIELLQQEARAAAKLNHPHIVGIIEAGQANEVNFIVMEYVDGGTVYDRLVKEKRIPEEDTLRIIRQIALALAHAHSRGFIHRDVKPKNIMLTRQEGIAKLADLGLARSISDETRIAQETGKALGTPLYISPEQAIGKEVGSQTDLYSLGCTMYHMLTGRVPFEGGTGRDVMRKHIVAHAIPVDHLVPNISQSTAEIVEMMMQKKTSDRYSTAQEVVEDVDLALAGAPTKYARKAPDLTATPQGDSHEPSVIPSFDHSSGLFSSTTGIVVGVLLIGSLLANLIFVLLRWN
ncbi:MAG: serine/threonine-protein kinase [Planctomycetota bacterium]|nr:serine/threonine-protein kinase [Planctomycetota bacterium]